MQSKDAKMQDEERAFTTFAPLLYVFAPLREPLRLKHVS